MSDDDKLIHNLQNNVKKSQSDLDANTLGQLRAARRNALDSLKHKSTLWSLLKSNLFFERITNHYIVSSVFVVVLTVGFTFTIFTLDDSAEQYDMDIVAISEELELLEDLDFYLWVADTVENES